MDELKEVPLHPQRVRATCEKTKTVPSGGGGGAQQTRKKRWWCWPCWSANGIKTLPRREVRALGSLLNDVRHSVESIAESELDFCAKGSHSPKSELQPMTPPAPLSAQLSSPPSTLSPSKLTPPRLVIDESDDLGDSARVEPDAPVPVLGAPISPHKVKRLFFEDLVKMTIDDHPAAPKCRAKSPPARSATT
mmetsp:Transcript_2660/g.8335  ORF Transcript_2660/g.8335 Transcript_2660/m.8335 type:complete len:192 (-) Transcript_2660:331-906(-)